MEQEVLLMHLWIIRLLQGKIQVRWLVMEPVQEILQAAVRCL